MIFLILFSFFSYGENIIPSLKVDKPIIIDAFEDVVWNTAPSFSSFSQVFPSPLEKASLETSFKTVYSDDFLFFYIISKQKKSTIITKQAKHDAGTNETDWVLVSIDPFKNGSIGYSFAVNPSGSQWDARLLQNGQSQDNDWNAIWECSSRIEEDYWVVEMKIPLRELEFQSKETQDWGVQVYRNIQYLQEQSTWIPVDPNIGFKVNKFGTLKNLKGLTSKNPTTFLPSFVTNFNSSSGYNPIKTQRTLGLDIKYKIDQKHSAFVTLQPDFAQIEVDKDEINLTRYPLMLQEKRPFFLNANNLFDIPGNIYYSRRMTRPRAGAQFYGRSNNFKYGVLFVNNDGQVNNVRSNENFVFNRVKYENAQGLSLGYYLGHVDSEQNETGQVHMLDFHSQINEQLSISGYLATSTVFDKSEKNHKYEIVTSYNTEHVTFDIVAFEVSKHFNQQLTGFISPTNEQLFSSHLDYRFKFSNFFLRQIEIHNRYMTYALETNDLPSKRYEMNIKNMFYTKSLGLVHLNFGVTRYKRYFRDYNQLNNKKMLHSDNFGTFTGEKTDGGSEFVYLRTDFSKAFALSVEVNRYDFYKSSINGFNSIFHIRPMEDLSFQLKVDKKNIEGSDFISKGSITSYSLKMEYAIKNNLFIKTFGQYNNQSDTFGFNMVTTYEYDKGSFLYLAYTESGTTNELFNQKQYTLKNRALSLKWTYSLFL